MSKQDINVFLAATWDHYRIELRGAGLSDEQASRNIAQNKEDLFVNGEPNDAQRFFDAMSDDLKVGVLWLASREELNPGEWFVYDIDIDEPFRGKGFGRGTMQAAEEYVMSQGGKAIGLNVFGQNSVARNLYEAMDYRATAIIMKKHLS